VASVFLTGATGFVGSHVLRELHAAGHSVRALVRSRDAKLEDVEIVVGDLYNPGALTLALDGCRYLVHCAALYSFAPSAREEMRRINVIGTAGILEAARIAGVERAVVTSSSATRYEHSSNGSPYHRSKVEQERAALAARVPAVLILPTAPIGPGDAKPTPTGRMVLDFAKGRVNVLPPRGGMNVVAVEDVAKAHVAALERGEPRERYVIGGENLDFDEIWQMLADATGRPMPRIRIPYGVAWGAAVAEEVLCRFLPEREPRVPLEGVRLSRERMFVEDDSARAILDVGAPTPAREAIARAVEWYRTHGYVS
jgi:dihydroflavonol-4-reductase